MRKDRRAVLLTDEIVGLSGPQAPPILFWAGNELSTGGTVSRSLNKVMLIGNLGSDPEVRSTTGGNRVATFSIATTRNWNSPNGEKQEKTEWHRCVVWNSKGTGLADVVEKFCKKGDRIYVEGRIEYRQWQDKENQTRGSTEINVRELLMLGGGRGSPGGRDFEGESRGRSRRPAAPGAKGRPRGNGGGRISRG